MNNAKKGMLAVLAVGLMVLFIGGFVAALETSAIASTTVSPVQADGKVVVARENARVIPYGDDVINTNERRAAAARLSNADDVRNVMRARLAASTVAQRSDFRASIERVRMAIAEARKDPSRDDFKGFSLSRLLGATGLTQEQKDDLTQVFRASKNGASVEKASFTLTSAPDNFVAVGKFYTTRSSNDLGGTLVGFSNLTNKRFFGIWGAGVIVGVSDGKVFWGKYWVDNSGSTPQQMFELDHFADKRVITGNYFIY